MGKGFRMLEWIFLCCTRVEVDLVFIFSSLIRWLIFEGKGGSSNVRGREFGQCDKLNKGGGIIVLIGIRNFSVLLTF